MTTHRSLLRRRARRPQLERRTPLRPAAAAMVIMEALALWLGEALPRGWVAGLAHRARRVYAHSPAFRAKMNRAGDGPRDLLHVFLQHWLADRLLRDRPDLFRRLPLGYATGASLPERRASGGGGAGGVEAVYLSPAQRWLAGW